MTICDLKRGESAIVLGLNLPLPLKERLRALNLYPRAVLTVRKISLFRFTYLVQAEGTLVALRKNVAREIRIIKRG